MWNNDRQQKPEKKTQIDLNEMQSVDKDIKNIIKEIQNIQNRPNMTKMYMKERMTKIQKERCKTTTRSVHNLLCQCLLDIVGSSVS